MPGSGVGMGKEPVGRILMELVEADLMIYEITTKGGRSVVLTIQRQQS